MFFQKYCTFTRVMYNVQNFKFVGYIEFVQIKIGDTVSNHCELRKLV